MTRTLASLHPSGLSPREAVALQETLRARVVEAPLERAPETIAGLDVSIRGDLAQAAVVVLALPSLEVVDRAICRAPVAFPYVPGLLAFRELPALLPALEQLRVWPDVFMLDAQGRAHPRRFGLACHLGVLLDAPALGVAKTLFVGTYDGLGEERGARAPLVHRGEVVGEAVRTRARVQPVYVSVGHRVTLDDASALALATSTRYRLPEPTRQAHLLSRETEG